MPNQTLPCFPPPTQKSVSSAEDVPTCPAGIHGPFSAWILHFFNYTEINFLP